MAATASPEVFLPDTAQRALVRASIVLASQAIPVNWPIATFIALNPLGGWEDRPFAEAMAQAEQWWRCQGYLPLSAYHTAYRSGRITPSDLAAAIHAFIATADLPETITVGAQTMPLAEILERWVWEKPPERGADSLPATLADWCPTRVDTTLVEVINDQMITWCAAFFDEGQATWTMPHRHHGFWLSWRSLACSDRFWVLGGMRAAPQRLAQLSHDPYEAMAALLQRMLVPEAEWGAYLTRHLTQLPGWAGAIRWREAHPERSTQMPCTLAEYLAIRLFYEAELVAAYAARHWRIAGTFPTMQRRHAEAVPSPRATPMDRLARLARIPVGRLESRAIPDHAAWQRLGQCLTRSNPAQIWQDAYEHHYRKHLIQSLQRPFPSRSERPEAQAIFCIDVRSEGLRRQLEARGKYTTFGAAGFFGLPMTFRASGAARATDQCPALVTPTYAVTEEATGPVAQRRLRSDHLWQTWRTLIHGLRTQLFTPFTLVEAVGWLLLFPLVARTLWPRTTHRLLAQMRTTVAPAPATQLSLMAGDARLSGLAHETQATLAEQFLRAIGLTQDFAPLVVICGHGSHTANNPYAAALDCGACGGQHGGPNARVAAQILNDPAVRARLATHGISIPAPTYFLAGEHTTTTDSVTLFPDDALPAPHLPRVARLTAALAEAGRRNAADRAASLPGAAARRRHRTPQVATRAVDWAQLVPEWGLAGNAAFICGRRELTAGLDLQQRVFLHSYDPAHDPSGSILEGIFTAPLIVAVGINLQYYCSTVAPQVWGSGNKLLHSLMGTVGVMSGRHSDLRLGLPLQSVQTDGRCVHEPMRLVAIIDAPPARVTTILARQPELARLVRNGWLALMVRDPLDGTLVQATGQNWLPVA